MAASLYIHPGVVRKASALSKVATLFKTLGLGAAAADFTINLAKAAAVGVSMMVGADAITSIAALTVHAGIALGIAEFATKGIGFAAEGVELIGKVLPKAQAAYCAPALDFGA